MAVPELSVENIKQFVLGEISQRVTELFFIYNIEEKKIIHVNNRVTQLWEKDREEIMEDPFALVTNLHLDDRRFVEDFFKKILISEEREHKLDFRIHTPSGKEKNLAATVYLIERDGKKAYLSGFIKDNTEHKKFETNLFEISAKKNSTLEILTHDIAGPLSMIKNFTFYLQEGIKTENYSDLLMYIDLIRDTSERSIRMITSLVNYEFLSSTQVTLNIDRIDLVQKIRDVVEYYKLSEKELIKSFHLKASNEKIFAEVDEVKFIQVINNLISNSIKFTRDHGSIHISLEEKEHTVLITIQDDGIGIPEKFHSVLFDRFTKARRPGLKGEETVGLGMSIIRKLLELHDGKIWFNSQENEGSSFFLEIPRFRKH